jgi:hypothetical protein
MKQIGGHGSSPLLLVTAAAVVVVAALAAAMRTGTDQRCLLSLSRGCVLIINQRSLDRSIKQAIKQSCRVKSIDGTHHRAAAMNRASQSIPIIPKKGERGKRRTCKINKRYNFQSQEQSGESRKKRKKKKKRERNNE